MKASLMVSITLAACGSPQAAPPGHAHTIPLSQNDDDSDEGPTLAARVASESSGSKTDLVKRFVAVYAKARARHCAGKLSWSDALATHAQQSADHIATNGCKPEQSVGQTVSVGGQGKLDPEMIVQGWYDEIEKYDFGHGGFSPDTGHFTLLVWRATEHVGCGHASCNDKEIWVCEYDPPGNLDGGFDANVLAPGCKP
jgi:hypothetical protein